MTQNAILAQDAVAARIAEQTLQSRRAGYADEVQRLLDAGLAVMRQRGTQSRPRVADIVSAAGLSNDAFYRHFPSKDALVRAILESGSERLASYLSHQMSKHNDPPEQVRAWVTGVLAQAADPETAASTLAVLWNAGSLGEATGGVPFGFSESLGELLREPLQAVGSADPALDASLTAHAVVGRLAYYLRTGMPPASEVDRVVAFCLARASDPAAPPPASRGRKARRR